MGKPESCPEAMEMKPHQVAVVGCCWWCLSMCVCFLCVCVCVVPGSQELYLLEEKS